MSVRSDRFLPAMLFLLFLPSRCTLMEKLTPPSIPPSFFSFFLLFYSSPFLFSLLLSFLPPPSSHPPSTSTCSCVPSRHFAPPPPAPLHHRHSSAPPTRSLWVNRSPLARALLWSRPPSSCFLNPPAEWVSDWPTQRETGERSGKRRWLFFLSFFFFY